MGEIDVTIDAKGVTPEQIKSVLDMAKRLVTFGLVMARLTRTELDDKVLAFIDKFVDTVTPYAAEPWVIELVGWLIALMGQQGPAVVVERLKAIFKR